MLQELPDECWIDQPQKRSTAPSATLNVSAKFQSIFLPDVSDRRDTQIRVASAAIAIYTET